MTSKEMTNLTMRRSSVPMIEVLLPLRIYTGARRGTNLALTEQLRLGTAKVREVLGPQLHITDKEIEDSLWHYYYDVDKTVNYLLSMT